MDKLISEQFDRKIWVHMGLEIRNMNEVLDEILKKVSTGASTSVQHVGDGAGSTTGVQHISDGAGTSTTVAERLKSYIGQQR